MECVIGLYKTECNPTTVCHSGPYRAIGDVEYATAGWVDWYNNRGMMATVELEQAHYTTLNREPQPVEERRRTWGASLAANAPTGEDGGRCWAVETYREDHDCPGERSAAAKRVGERRQ